MNKTFSVSIIIPNWNGRKLLEKYLPSVIQAAGESQIIVVDDASTDDSVPFLLSTYPKVTVIQQKTNRGFSSSVNKGVAVAKTDIVVLLNTDIEPDKFFLDPLLVHFEKSEVFAVGCLEKSLENDSVVLRGPGVSAWQRGMFIHRKGNTSGNTTAWVSGGSGAFRKKYWDILKGMDELYNPFYWEDIDLSYRAKKSGYSIVFEPKSVVIHKHEEGSIRTSAKKKFISIIAFRNQLIFIWKNITDFSLLTDHLIHLPIHLFRPVLKGELEFLSGFIQACLMLPAIRRQKAIAKNTFVKSDKELLSERFT